VAIAQIFSRVPNTSVNYRKIQLRGSSQPCRSTHHQSRSRRVQLANLILWLVLSARKNQVANKKHCNINHGETQRRDDRGHILAGTQGTNTETHGGNRLIGFFLLLALVGDDNCLSSGLPSESCRRRRKLRVIIVAKVIRRNYMSSWKSF
jgi:hypothetical protein